MGGTSEREYKEKINKILERLHKQERDVQKESDKIEKIRIYSLKKAEDMRRSADNDVNKMEKDIAKSKDLAPESKQRLQSEIIAVRTEIENKYARSRNRIAENMVPIEA